MRPLVARNHRHRHNPRLLRRSLLNSSVIHSPDKAAAQLAEQDRWLRDALTTAKAENPRHIVVFQHHPWFLKSAAEPDQYFNSSLVRRSAHLALFREFGVRP